VRQAVGHDVDDRGQGVVVHPEILDGHAARQDLHAVGHLLGKARRKGLVGAQRPYGLAAHDDLDRHRGQGLGRLQVAHGLEGGADVLGTPHQQDDARRGVRRHCRGGGTALGAGGRSRPDGDEQTDDQDVTTGLNQLLTSATVFYQKVRDYHWNVTGVHFFGLHDRFENLYTVWNDTIDEIAEQVRSRGDRPVHTLADVLDLASIEEDPSTPSADEMVQPIVSDLSALDESVQSLIDRAEAAGDDGTAALFEDLRDQIEEDRWMLRAWLNDL